MAAQVQLTINVNESQVRQQLKDIQDTINQMVNKQYTIQMNATDLKNVKTTLVDINDQSKQLVQNTGSLDRVFRQVWGQAAKYVREALTEMKAVDTELVTIQKVTGDTAEGMKRYANDAYEVASRLGASAHEYLNAVAEFAKAGYKDRSKELGELAIMTAKVGDTTQQTANQFLLSVDAAYKYHGSIEKLTAVLDGANEIGNRFPTSVQKIAEGLGKVSPIAAQAHVGIDELSAAIGTISAVTQRSGTETATALRALFLNIIGDTKTEIEDGAKWTAGEIEGLRDVLRKYAPDVVKAAEATKTVINPMEAVAALSQAIKDGFLTENELMKQVTDIGGKLRSSQLLALIQNYDIYLQQLETFRESAGSAAKEFSIYIESWEAKTNQLSTTWTDFVQRQLGSQEIKELLDLLIKIVGNLDSWVPLIKSIGIAIAMLKLPSLITTLSTLITSINVVPTILGGIVMAIGLVDSAIKQHAVNLHKAAEESLDNAKKELEEVNSMIALSSQYATAAENSEEFRTASEQMKKALEDEGIAVDNLTEKYRAHMRSVALAASIDAQTALSKAEPALVSSYKANRKKASVGSLTSKERDNDFLRGVSQRLEASGAVAGGFTEGGSYEYALAPADLSAAGISAYYEAVATSMREIEEENYRLVSSGEKSTLLQTNYYRGLSAVLDTLGDSYTTYSEARTNATEAERTAKSLNAFFGLQDTITNTKMSEEALRDLLTALKDNEELSDSMKSALTDMIRDTYPQYAEALGLVTKAYKEQTNAVGEAESALSRYKKAMEGSDKDDQFKEYKSVYDEVMKAAKRGAYGSNAFQYGIQALVDPEKIKEFKGNWAGLVKYIQDSQGALYKNADSMGQGLLDRIYKAGDKAGKQIRQIKDESGKLLAEYNKGTGEWKMSNDPEDIKKLASTLGMSAESLVAAGIALGAMDPSADVEGLSKALETILGGGEEKLSAQELAAEAQNKAAEAQDKAADAEEKAAEALLVAAHAVGGGGMEREDGFVGTTNPVGDAQNARDAAIRAAMGSNSFKSKDKTPVVNTGVVFGPTRETIEAIETAIEEAEQQDIAQVAANRERKIRATGPSAKVATLEDKLLSHHLPSNSTDRPDLVVRPGAGALDDANAKIAAWMAERYSKPATESEPVPVEIISNKDSDAYHNGDRGGMAVGPANLLIDMLSALVGEGSGAKVSVDTTEATEAITTTKEDLDELDNTEVESVATVNADGAKEGAAEANDAIAGIVRSVSTDVWINIHYSGGGGRTHGGSGMEREGDDGIFGASASGDPYFKGGAVLVNDEPGGYNPELIVANGRAFIANGGNPVVLNLPRGSVIYNADETRSIFNGGADLLNIPSYADSEGSLAPKDYGFSGGTGSKPYTPKKKITSPSGSRGGGSGGGSMSDDDMLKQLNEYMSQILEAAHDALDDQLEAINAQIYALKYQTEAAEKASALEEARLELLQAEQNLLDANTERTVRYYNAATGQWEWMADQRKVLQAQEELADAQKNLLEAEYDALTTAWKELKDEIEKALKGESGPIDIDKVLAALGKSAASGSKGGVESLIADIFGYTDDPRAYANFDGGGIAHGLGWMPKGNAGAEAVLDSNITNAILNPVTNAAFQGFTDSLTNLFQLAGGGVGLPSSRFGGNISNLYGGNTYIEGVKIGSDMMSRPLSEVLSTLNLYKNA